MERERERERARERAKRPGGFPSAQKSNMGENLRFRGLEECLEVPGSGV